MLNTGIQLESSFVEIPDDTSDESQKSDQNLHRTILSIYPNPARDMLYFKDVPQNDCHFSIYNVSGSLILQGEIANYNGQLSIRQLPTGSYILELQHLQRVIFNKKFIKA